MAGTGEIRVEDVPVPELRPGWVRVRNECSLISAGTERSRLTSSHHSVIGEVRADPHLLKKALDRARSEGLGSTWTATQARLSKGPEDELSALGYSCAGAVLETGGDVTGLAVGDRVACGGAGWANHAEVVVAPQNLIAKVPDGVSIEAASYSTLGAIALHAVRQADVGVGERVGVIGLGLVGQLAFRILSAAGCEPFGIDPDPQAVSLALTVDGGAALRSAPDLPATVAAFSRGMGLDAILVCAAGKSTDPLELAAQLARDRGRIVVVGDVPVSVPRALLYEKEIELRIARSYGPGRYDRDYEERGRDLPPGYVRWTEQRNLQAFLDLVARGRIDPTQLTTHRFPLSSAAEAYGVLTARDPDRRPFGIVLEYPVEAPGPDDVGSVRRPGKAVGSRRDGAVRVGLVGAGSFAQSILVPALREEGAALVAVASEGGLTAADAARHFGFERSTSTEAVLAATDIDAVVIATRHATHAALALAALEAGKTVFVEKPLALNEAELAAIERAAPDGRLMVGFNRRYAPLVERLLTELPETADATFSIRVNAGPLPDAHWLHDPEEGGGRLIGEGCHFVDLAAHLGRAPVMRVHAFAAPQPTRSIECSDTLVATLQLGNGAVASLVYSGGGSPKLAKERIEALAGGVALVLDDFQRLEVYGHARPRVVRTKQDKGHRATIARFLQAVAGTAELPPMSGYLDAMRATLALADSLRTGSVVTVSSGHGDADHVRG